MNCLSFSALVEFAKFLKLRDDTGGAIKILDQDDFEPVRVVIDHPITAEGVDDFNRITGRHWTKEKPKTPGFFFFRDPEGRVRMVEYDGESISFHGSDHHGYFDRPAWMSEELWAVTTPVEGEWQGPLEVPE